MRRTFKIPPKPRRARLRVELLEERITPSTYTVTDLSDNPADTGSIRYAVNQVNADVSAATDTIDLTGLSGTIVLSNGVLGLTRTAGSVAITGPGANVLTISGNNASGVFSIGNGVVASISELTIANGLAYQGGGIENNGTLTVNNSAFTGNIAMPDVLYVTNYPSVNAIGEYNASTGAAIHTTFISGLASPSSVALDGSGHLFVGNFDGNSIGEYNFSTGATVNAGLVTGLAHPLGVALDGAGHLYVVNYGNNSIGEYNATTGAAINTALITSLNNPAGLALDGAGDLFVSNDGNNSIGEYNATTGAVINPSFITGLNTPLGIALDGAGHLYVSNNGGGSIGEYNSSTGAAINASFVTALSGPAGLALDGAGHLYVVNYSGNSIGEYNSSTGAAINIALVTGLNGPVGIALASVSVPSGNLPNAGGGINNNGTLTVSGSTFSGNSSVTVGGGISNSGTATVSDSTVSGNSDGIYNSSTISVDDSTISGNKGNGFATVGTSSFLSTIIAGNGADIVGSVNLTESAYNLIGTGGSGGLSNGTNHNQVGVSNPGLDPIAYYGGRTQTIALQIGSPALQAGSSVLTTLSAPLAAGASNMTFTVNDATFLGVGLVIAIDGEQMQIAAVSGTNVTVTRGYNNTSAGAHTTGANLVIPSDQRGFARTVSGFTDVGALETQAIPVTIRSITVNGSTSPILSAAVSSGVVTITTDGPSGFLAGQSVLIAGVNGTGTASGFNGAYVITGVTGNAFTYVDGSAAGSTANIGTATVAGTLTGLLSGQQRSMVDSIVYVFNQAVNLGSNAIAISVLGQGGVVPTVSYASPDNGLTWVVTFSGNGVVSNSIANGEYRIALNNAAVSGVSGGGLLASSDTETFYRLFGDTVGNGHQRVNSADVNALLGTFNSWSALANFLAYLDYNTDGQIDIADSKAFLADFNIIFRGFVPTI